jgi:hypothetical protein
MNPIEVSPEEAKEFRKKHGDSIDLFERDGSLFMKLKKGALYYLTAD